MKPEGCEGTGAGYGTLEGRRLRVLVLAGEKERSRAQGVARSIEPAHDVTLLARGGAFVRFAAARAALASKADLIHAVGVRGAAAAAAQVAWGIDRPFLLSLLPENVEPPDLPLALIAARRCHALFCDREASALRMRDAGLGREIYVLPFPETDADRAFFLGAVEIVYGRLLADRIAKSVAGAAVDQDGFKLVTLPRSRGPT